MLGVDLRTMVRAQPLRRARTQAVGAPPAVELTRSDSRVGTTAASYPLFDAPRTLSAARDPNQRLHSEGSVVVDLLEDHRVAVLPSLATVHALPRTDPEFFIDTLRVARSGRRLTGSSSSLRSLDTDVGLAAQPRRIIAMRIMQSQPMTTLRREKGRP